jgi:hypothetical protein
VTPTGNGRYEYIIRVSAMNYAHVSWTYFVQVNWLSPTRVGSRVHFLGNGNALGVPSLSFPNPSSRLFSSTSVVLKSISEWRKLVDYELAMAAAYVIVDPMDTNALLYVGQREYQDLVRVAMRTGERLTVVVRPDTKHLLPVPVPSPSSEAGPAESRPQPSNSELASKLTDAELDSELEKRGKKPSKPPQTTVGGWVHWVPGWLSKLFKTWRVNN